MNKPLILMFFFLPFFAQAAIEVKMDIVSAEAHLASQQMVLNNNEPAMLSSLGSNGEGYTLKVTANEVKGQSGKIKVNFELTEITRQNQTRNLKRSTSTLVVNEGKISEWKGPIQSGERVKIKLQAKKLN